MSCFASPMTSEGPSASLRASARASSSSVSSEYTFVTKP